MCSCAGREAGFAALAASEFVSLSDVEPEYLIQSLQVRWIGEYLRCTLLATMDSLSSGILKESVLVPPINEQRR